MTKVTTGLWLNSIDMITELSGTFITEDIDNDDICDLILTQDDAGNPAGVGNRVEIMTIESGHVRCQAMSSQEKAGALPSQQHILTGITVSLNHCVFPQLIKQGGATEV